MKALITAFALLSFVAATTVPVVAHAQQGTEQGMKTKKAKHSKTKHTRKAAAHKMKKGKKPTSKPA